MAKISAQETTPGQALSTVALMLSTMSIPWIPSFGGPLSSLSMTPGTSTNRIDPSHPYTKPENYLKGRSYHMLQIYLLDMC